MPALGLLLLACQAEPTTPDVLSVHDGGPAALVDNIVAKVVVVPDSQLVFAGDQFRVTATAVNQADEPLTRTFTWKSNNTDIARIVGSSLSTMTFRAVKAGKTTVKASTDGKSRLSKVVVRATGGGRVIVTPEAATIAPGETVQLAAVGRTKNGETATITATWSSDGGSVSPGGLFGADAPGLYHVVARASFGAADTAVVTVSGTPDPVTELFLVPESADLEAGESLQFEVYGRTEGGDSVAVPATYSAQGGTITSGGRYTAGSVGGTYEITAAGASLTDAAQVVVSAPAVGSVALIPGTAASRPDETIRFSASALSSQGMPMSEAMTYGATCGTVSSTGVYRAPTGEPGPCLVTASAGEVADTTEVILLRSTPGTGTPFGINDLWSTATATRTNAAPMTASREYFPATEMAAHIEAARGRGVRLMLVMTGGSHDRYKTDGVFDQAKWEAAMVKFDTPALRDAIAAGVADGTIIGNSVMDEPQQSGTTSKDWGPPGTMTKARVDQLCAYVKNIFPTLPVGAGHDHSAFEPLESYQVCEFYMPQYAHRKGNVTAWRDAALAMAARDGMSVVFSMNLLDGGVQDKTGAYDCAGTGGFGTHGSNCRMTPAQVRDWGMVLGTAGCAFLSWRYDSDFMAKPENQAAFSEVAIALAGLPRRSCAGTR